MELKGKSAKKIPAAKKTKMDKTLKRMEETRQKDSTALRTVITNKLVVLKGEEKKAEEAIQATKKKTKDLEDLKLKIEGAIISLQEVLQNETNV
jgi:ABC-type transporter Mla subunit MlaD